MLAYLSEGGWENKGTECLRMKSNLWKETSGDTFAVPNIMRELQGRGVCMCVGRWVVG